MSARPSKAAACPCGSGSAYEACCGRWHRGEPAPSAQALMRSRYSAYVLGLEDYLRSTWHPTTRPSTLELQANATRWLGLEVRAASPPIEAVGANGQPLQRATVEFVARYRADGRGHRLHELSRFVFEADRWYYVDGDSAPAYSVGRKPSTDR